MWTEQYGYTHYLAREASGRMITHREFAALVWAMGIADEQMARWLGVADTTIRRWKDGLGMPSPRHQEAIRHFVEFARASLGPQVAARVAPYLPEMDEPAPDLEGTIKWEVY